MLMMVQMYAWVLQACMQVKACKSYDKYTWIGSSNVPLPFDINFQPLNHYF